MYSFKKEKSDFHRHLMGKRQSFDVVTHMISKAVRNSLQIRSLKEKRILKNN